jgi:hypothetical protein
VFTNRRISSRPPGATSEAGFVISVARPAG